MGENDNAVWLQHVRTDIILINQNNWFTNMPMCHGGYNNSVLSLWAAFSKNNIDLTVCASNLRPLHPSP